MKRELYFKNEDSENCYCLEDHLNEAREEGLTEITLLKAIPDDNSDYIWCMYMGEVGDRSECSKAACSYYPREQKGGKCPLRGQLYQHGEEETFKIE
jgi:hypothetical protein